MGGQKLSANASRVLLSVVLTRHLEDQIPKSEFAILAGLTHIAIVGALQELRQNGLVIIIQQGVKYEDVDEVSGMVVENAVVVASSDMAMESTPQGEEEPDPIEECRRADESGMRSQKIAALKVVWGGVFPVDQYDYEYAQLSDSFAKELTRGGRSAEWVGTIIQRIGERWGGKHLKSPVGYIRAAIEGEESKRARTPINKVEEEEEVDMNLMAVMAQAWREQR